MQMIFLPKKVVPENDYNPCYYIHIVEEKRLYKTSENSFTFL